MIGGVAVSVAEQKTSEEKKKSRREGGEVKEVDEIRMS